MYVYIYIHMYVCMYIHIYVSIYTHRVGGWVGGWVGKRQRGWVGAYEIARGCAQGLETGVDTCPQTLVRMQVSERRRGDDEARAWPNHVHPLLSTLTTIGTTAYANGSDTQEHTHTHEHARSHTRTVTESGQRIISRTTVSNPRCIRCVSH